MSQNMELFLRQFNKEEPFVVSLCRHIENWTTTITISSCPLPTAGEMIAFLIFDGHVCLVEHIRNIIWEIRDGNEVEGISDMHEEMHYWDDNHFNKLNKTIQLFRKQHDIDR